MRPPRPAVPPRHELLAHLEELRAEGRRLREALPQRDEAELRAEARALLTESRDAALHDAVWDYLEGTCDHRTLRRHPAYRAHVAARLAEELPALEATGVLGHVRDLARDEMRRDEH